MRRIYGRREYSTREMVLIKSIGYAGARTCNDPHDTGPNPTLWPNEPLSHSFITDHVSNWRPQQELFSRESWLLSSCECHPHMSCAWSGPREVSMSWSWEPSSGVLSSVSLETRLSRVFGESQDQTELSALLLKGKDILSLRLGIGVLDQVYWNVTCILWRLKPSEVSGGCQDQKLLSTLLRKGQTAEGL